MKTGLADKIRKYPHLTSREIADLLECSVKQVCTVRWRDANRNKVRQLVRDQSVGRHKVPTFQEWLERGQ